MINKMNTDEDIFIYLYDQIDAIKWYQFKKQSIANRWLKKQLKL